MSYWKSNLIGKVANTNLLLVGFVIYTLGDLIELVVNTNENKKRNPQQAFVLFCQKLASKICNLIIYWGAVFGLKRLFKHASQKFVEGYEPKETAIRAADRLSDILGLLGGLPFNDLLKPVAVSMLTGYFMKHPPNALIQLMGLSNYAPSSPVGGLVLKDYELSK